MKPLKLNWRIVLVRPRNPLNIGAAARALANFGLLEMAVVAPFEPTWEEARSAAVGAETVIASARAVPTLADAIDDATLVVGTTTGSRRNLGRELLPLPELAAWLRRRNASGRAALLFGSEKTGLSNEDMSHCHALVRIPTTLDCPSMNLGQAVAVCAYELVRAGIVSVRPPARYHASLRARQPANPRSRLGARRALAGCVGLSPTQKPRGHVDQAAPLAAQFKSHLQRCSQSWVEFCRRWSGSWNRQALQNREGRSPLRIAGRDSF